MSPGEGPLFPGGISDAHHGKCADADHNFNLPLPLRRHLSQEQKRFLITAQVVETPHLSDRKIARGLGVSPTTVGTARSELIETGQVSDLDTSLGADGKWRPRITPS